MRGELIKVIEEKITPVYEDEEVNTKTLILENNGEQFLVPIFELNRDYIKEFILSNFEDYVDLEKYIKDTLSHLSELEEFNFLTDTQFGIEIEGGWDGDLRLNGFNSATDNSFEITNKQYNNEFVYNGCDNAVTVLSKLYENFGKLKSHGFTYNRECGTHIHFSQFGRHSKGFKEKDLLKLTVFLTNIEDILFDIIPVYRAGLIDKLNGEIQREGGYGKTIYHKEDKFLSTIQEIRYRLNKEQITDKNIDRYIKKLMKTWYDNHIDTRREKYNITRYHGINLHSYFYRNSMELRHFEGNYKNLVYYIDLVDKIMYLIENFEWTTIDKLLTKLDSYSRVATKSAALLYSLGVSNRTLSKLLSRTDRSQLNIVRTHSFLNSIREKITDGKAKFIENYTEEDNIEDVTCYPENIDRNADYTKRKYRIVEKIMNKKGELKQLEFHDVITEEFTGQDLDEFEEYINNISQQME